MIVIDASSAAELLLNTVAGRRLSLRLRDETEIIHVPHLIDLEIAGMCSKVPLTNGWEPWR